MTTDNHDTTDRTIVITRHIGAPPEVVFAALTDPEHLDQWWGPTGFATTTHAFDLRVGGTWEYTMVGPDGTEYPNLVEWVAIEPPSRLIYRHGEAADDPDTFITTLTVAPTGAGSDVTLTSVFPTREHRNRAATEYHAIEGGNQTLDALDAHLAAMDAGR